MVLAPPRQYRASVAGDAFANGPVAVAGVVPGSPAAGAAIAPGDGIAAIGQQPTATMARVGEAPLRDTALAALAEERPVVIAVVRGGQERVLTLDAPSGCRALVEIRAADSLDARSDGRVIQVNYGLALAATDEQLAVVFAHELGHLVLEHRRRLEAAGVEKGFFGEFGRNRRLNRQLSRGERSRPPPPNAVYDPRSPGVMGSRLGAGRLRSPAAELSFAKARAEMVEREAAGQLAAGPDRASRPCMLRRDVP